MSEQRSHCFSDIAKAIEVLHTERSLSRLDAAALFEAALLESSPRALLEARRIISAWRETVPSSSD